MNWLLLGAGALLIAVFAVGAYLGIRRYSRGDISVLTARASTRTTTGAVSIVEHLTSFRAKAFYALVAILAGTVAVLWFSWTFAGPIDTIIYASLFLFVATAFPFFIALLGNAMPGAIHVAKLHIVLGQFAFGRGVLVQREDRYEWCPATKDRVYIDGKWHDIEGGSTNWSMLGWRPFGIARFKTDDTLSAARADTKAARDRASATDGGGVERASITELEPRATTGIDGEWLLDLKRVVTRGIKKIGDIELIETAEEVTMREEAKNSQSSMWAPIVGSIVGLAIGGLTGYVMLVGG